MLKRDINVLHVGLSNNLGGIENVVRSWNNLLPNHIHFDFINNCEGHIAFQKDFEANGAKIYDIIPRKKNPMKSYKQICKIINSHHYDYVQHHMMSFSWPEPLYIAQHHENTRAIAHCHTAGAKNLSSKYKILDSYGRWMLNTSKYLKIACGFDAGKDMFHTEKFSVIKNGVDFSGCEFNQNMRKYIREQYKLSDDIFLIGHVGRSGDAKNYPFIIQLFDDFVKARPNSILMLIGNVKDDYEIRNLVNRKGLQKKIIFTGILDELKNYYSAMDVFILPSLYEGVSVAMIEAQVSGLTCVVSKFVSKDADISGNVEYISINNTDEGVSELLRIKKKNRAKEYLKLDYSYDLASTANEMFSFYEDNLK